MVVKITKETWEKCDIKTIYYFNKEKGMLELWLKMGDIEVKLGHSNIADVVLKRIRKYCSKKKQKTQKKKKYKTFFEGEKCVFIIKRLTCDVMENCKLPEAIDFRKKMGYNHNDIMVHEEASTAEKLVKFFPDENIVLNKKFNDMKPDIWFKNRDTIVEIDE